jgi:hypothetical protein
MTHYTSARFNVDEPKRTQIKNPRFPGIKLRLKNKRDLIAPDHRTEATYIRAENLQDLDLMPVIVSQDIALQSVNPFLLEGDNRLHNITHRHQSYQLVPLLYR